VSVVDFLVGTPWKNQRLGFKNDDFRWESPGFQWSWNWFSFSFLIFLQLRIDIETSTGHGDPGSCPGTLNGAKRWLL